MPQRCMPPESLSCSITSLMSSQIDWNKVADDPMLKNQITNGHAARMRYARFKKQMEGTVGERKPRAPATPRKRKDGKKRGSPKNEERQPCEDVMNDDVRREAPASGLSSAARTAEPTPEAGEMGLAIGQPRFDSHDGSPGPSIKREPGLARYPMTPHSQSQTPSPEFAVDMAHHRVDMAHHSFGYGMAPTGLSPGYGMSGLHDQVLPQWQGEENAFYPQEYHEPMYIKREGTWDDEYRGET